MASVLLFVMQLEADPEDLADCFDFVVRKVAPGPYNWISSWDLANLDDAFSFQFL